MIKYFQLKIILTCLLLFAVLFSFGKSIKHLESKVINTSEKNQMDCTPATAGTSIEVNNVRAHLRTAGTIYYQDGDALPGYEVPKGQNKHSIFAGALWVGALDDENNLKLAAQTYRQRGEDFWPGPLDENGETSASTCNEFDRFWKITAKEVDEFKADFEDGTVDEVISSDFNTWPGPFVDADGNNVYNPAKGDYPKINGDEAIWYVINDNGNIHSSTPGSVPLGLEIQAMIYAFNSQELANVTFSDYTLLNKSSENLKKTYLGTWLDPDLGNYEDDFVGCDTLRNLGICYNGDNDDDADADGYGMTPPFVGVQILNGIQTASGEKLGMSGFVFYNNADDPIQSDPNDAQEHYNYLIGKWKDGTPITSGGTGLNPGSTDEVPYMFPSDPSDPDGWSECAESNTPADRRFVMSTGPFDMAPGASKSMTQAILWIRPPGAFADGCPTFKGIQDLADEVLEFYETNISGDDVAPVITLDGDDFFTLDVGTDWTPPAATAVDNVDGDVEVNIDDSELNLNADGTYEVIYTATDSSGNTATKPVTVVVGTGVMIGIFDKALANINLYPNPATDKVFIDLKNLQADNIKIFDLNGKLIAEKSIKTSTLVDLDVSHFNDGVYFYQVLNNLSIVSINKFIKQ